MRKRGLLFREIASFVLSAVELDQILDSATLITEFICCKALHIVPPKLGHGKQLSRSRMHAYLTYFKSMVVVQLWSP